jgi:hypothetical protein
MIKAAAKMFSIFPVADASGQKLTFGQVQKIYTPLKTTITLLQDDMIDMCIITSHWLGVHYYQYSNVLRRQISRLLGIPFERVLVLGSHNHCSAALTKASRVFGQPMVDMFLTDEQLTTDGRQLLQKSLEAAADLKSKLVPVTVSWGQGHEARITHNNKGRNPDGSTYMIRHDERMRLGEDFHGDIDAHAPVVRLSDYQGRPVVFLTQFTGHPTTAYHPDFAVVHGEYPQIACDDLSIAYDGIPVAFMQGCAADSYSIGSFSGKSVQEVVQEAERNGHLLGETYVKISRDLIPSSRAHLRLAWEPVFLPYEPLPSAEYARGQLAMIDDFIARCTSGDPHTLQCAGLNFPPSFSLEHRINLVQPVKDWVQWILDLHRNGNQNTAPKGLSTPVAGWCIGDVAFGALACEPFMGIGRRLRSASPFPLTIPCGYANDTSVVNIPDSCNNGDMDFMSSTYRYTTTMLAYQQPAGDLLATALAQLLKNMW